MFSELVYRHFQPYRDEWFFENRIPELCDVRGRGILMTRFEAAGGSWAGNMGIHPSTWPDSRKEGFVWDCAGTPFRIQDWYRVQSFLEIPEKFQAVCMAHWQSLAQS
jgi:1-phosphatidylinositol phosphodiesterase